MTTDVVINNIINDLCQRFNVASSELIPRLQAYGMAMNKFGAIAAGIFCVALIIGIIFLLKADQDWADVFCVLFGIAEIFSGIIRCVRRCDHQICLTFFDRFVRLEFAAGYLAAFGCQSQHGQYPVIFHSTPILSHHG